LGLLGTTVAKQLVLVQVLLYLSCISSPSHERTKAKQQSNSEWIRGKLLSFSQSAKATKQNTNQHNMSSFLTSGFEDALERLERKPAAADNGGGKRQKVGAQKFTKTTKAYAKLKEMFETKQILPTDKPIDIRAKDPLFQDFTHNQFRSQFNNLRKEMGTCTREGEH
jgi:hypothetical protein